MKKKILIIINNLGIGGAERLVADDINEMLNIGISVVLVTLVPNPQKNFSSELRLNQDNFIQLSFKSIFDIFSWPKLIFVIRSLKPDLVITHLWYANTIGRIACVLAGSRNVISFEQNVYDTVKTKKMFFVDWFLQFFSTRIIAVSEAVKKSLTRHSIQEKRIDVLYNSVNLSKFFIPHTDFGIRKEYHIPEQSFIYLFIGRLIHQKAVDVLIRAFEKVGSDSYLLIVGQGVDRYLLEQKVKDLRLEKRVIFTGVRNDISLLLSSADCFILPSRHEGLPLVLIEALATGLAIIVSDFEAAKEVIIDKENGLVFTKEDVFALAKAMVQIREDKSLRLKLAQESKKTSELFSISHHVQEILRYANI